MTATIFNTNRASSVLGDDIAEVIGEKTMVHTPDLVPDVEKQQEREKLIEGQNDGLPVPVEIPDGGLLA